jgi:hypothetical protein
VDPCCGRHASYEVLANTNIDALRYPPKRCNKRSIIDCFDNQRCLKELPDAGWRGIEGFLEFT